MSIKPGRFIVVEGLEGAGKTTAMKTIKRMLAELQLDFITTREPGGTFVGETVRQIIKKSPIDEPLDSRSELLLFYAARVQLLEQVIKPALGRGSWVLADRFELSSFAYQGGGRRLDERMLQSLSSFCVGDCQPDLIVFLDLKPEQGLERALKRGKLDRIEQESLNFFNDVYAGYHKHIKTLTNVIMIDASKSLPIVQNMIRTELHHAISTVA
ncbi:MAG: dTMP kinase [Legionellaceae bacterium]|nr:dTMP kinase [Legionellaceae bacterium]